jgi:adenosylhomocysteine nucleosidase
MDDPCKEKSMIGCIAAMQEECDALLEYCSDVKLVSTSPFKLYTAKHHKTDVIIGLSGIGKVSAAAMTSFMILTYKPSLLINIGSAGGLDSKLSIGDLVVSTMCAYHDFDISAFGHEINYEKGWYVFKSEQSLIKKIASLSFDRLHFGPMVCGDQFVSSQDVFKQMSERFNGVLATDMESTAVAHVATLHDVPWIIARSISDLVFNHDNHVAFDEYLKLASKNSARFVSACLDLLAD